VGSVYVQLGVASAAPAPATAATLGTAASSASAAAPALALKQDALELTLPQFYDLLSQLETAKSFMDYLSAVPGDAADNVNL
jgi:hypothetical protein